MEVLEAREKGGPHHGEKVVKAEEAAGGIAVRKSFQWISRTKRHKSGTADSRKDSLPVKEEAAKLG